MVSSVPGEAARVEREGALAVLTLDSPPLNLFDRAMIDALAARVRELAAEPPRGLLIRAEGRVVSGGVNVNVFEGMTPTTAADMFRELITIVRLVEELPCPTVFAAHALTLTAAFELALGCDLILAAEGAEFGLVEAQVGITPGMGGTQRLAERAGHARAREFVMTADLYDVETMHSWGVVNRVLPRAGFDAAARAFATRLAEGPTIAHAATKKIIRGYLDGGTARADRLVPSTVGALYATEDLLGAVETFLAEGPGKATFKGR
jgi:enoyl-CoA hydratase/carnithine racemase